MVKGFTLVELLAVIVILAVLALIATPVVLSIIDDAKESAMLRSAEMYLSGVENAVMRENMNSGGNFRPNECSISNEGNLDCAGKDGIIEVEVNGEKPSNGSIVFENGKITEVTLNYQSGTIVKDESGNLVYEGSGSLEEELAPGLYDEEGNMVYSWEELLSSSFNYTCPCCDTEYTNARIMELSDDGTLITKDCPTSGYPCIGAENILVGNLVIDDSVKQFEESVFRYCKNLTSVTIPSSVTSLSSSMFDECINLKSVSIPNSVTSIGEHAFSGCTNLTDIVIPNSVTSIGEHAFSGCTNLTDIVIPNSVTSIGESTFSGCTSLTSIYISSSVTSIDDNTDPSYSPFYECSPNLKIYCGSNEKPSGWNSYWNYYDYEKQLSVEWGVTQEEYDNLIS